MHFKLLYFIATFLFSQNLAYAKEDVDFKISKTITELKAASLPTAYNDCLIYGYIVLSKKLEGLGDRRPPAGHMIRVCQAKYESELSTESWLPKDVKKSEYFSIIHGEFRSFVSQLNNKKSISDALNDVGL